MNDLASALQTVQHDFHQALTTAQTIQELDAVHAIFLSRNGTVATLIKSLHCMPVEEKRIYAPRLNELKNSLLSAFEEKKQALHEQIRLAARKKNQFFDVTASRFDENLGSTHIYTQIIQDLEDIFISMGFEIADGPEVETGYYNFEALNIPADHPAREMHDTFWLNDKQHHLLRTHTSNVQARYIEKKQFPLALFAPGRCYRNEATDASHEFMFTQGECMYIDTNVSISNLLFTAREFLQKIFNKKVEIRVRPGYFPFVEPGVEIDASCPFCNTGCCVCKKTGWIELMGAGLVHPNVLRASGIDPDKYSGFAIGFGIERIAMVKYGITDIRLFHSSKLSFLQQYTSV